MYRSDIVWIIHCFGFFCHGSRILLLVDQLEMCVPPPSCRGCQKASAPSVRLSLFGCMIGRPRAPACFSVRAVQPQKTIQRWEIRDVQPIFQPLTRSLNENHEPVECREDGEYVIILVPLISQTTAICHIDQFRARAWERLGNLVPGNHRPPELSAEALGLS